MVIDLATNAVVATIQLPEGGGGDLAIAPDGKHAYATWGSFPGAVSVINLENLTLDGPPIGVGNSPRGIAVTADGAYAYVANFFNTGPFGTVSVIDLATRAVVATIPVGSQPAAIAILPDGSRVYVANAGADTVSVIDLATQTVIGSAIPIEDNPQGIALSPDGARVYVTNFNSHSVSVIETASDTLVGTIQVGFFPHGIAVTPDGRRLYVVDDGSVAVVDTATQRLTARVPIPPFHSLMRVAVSSDGARAYVTVNIPQSVLTIDTATDTVVGAAIPIAGLPDGIALSPASPGVAVTPFGAFHAAVRLLAARDGLRFEAQGMFVPDRASDGIHPDREAVTLSFATSHRRLFSQTLPAGKFHRTGRNSWLFRAFPPPSGIRELTIRRTAHGRFLVDVRGWTDTWKPGRRGSVAMSLQIGNDGGTADRLVTDREPD